MFTRIQLQRIDRILLFVACGCGMLLIALDAAGAHALRGRLSPKQLETLVTAVRIGSLHSLFVVVALMLAAGGSSPWRRLPAGLSLLGVLLFSGGLCAYVLSGQRLFVHLAPVGGLALMAAWLSLALLAAGRASDPN